VLLRLEEITGIRPQAMRALLGFRNLIQGFRAEKDIKSVTQMVQAVYEKSGYLAELERERTVEAQTRIENLKELLTDTLNFEATTEEPTVSAFLEHASLMSDIDTLEEGEDAVVLMTLHSAKGLEFPVVFLAGMEEGVFPHARSMQQDSQMEEERRLAYVGVTRAREQLFLSYAVRRTIFGNTQFGSPSRFIKEIPREMLQGMQGTRLPGQPKPDEGYVIGSGVGRTPALATKPPVLASAPSPFKVGEKVKHAIFGQGVVVSVSGGGEEAQVSVAFPNVGIKKLVAKYAKLEKV
jgi:DNA helicase-2/ATP-dependent DNA helicase PcrA